MSKYVYTRIYIYWYTSSPFALGGGVIYQIVVELIKNKSLQYSAINAKFKNNQINTQPKYDHYQFNWPLATKNRPNQLTVPVWTEQ